MRSTIASGVPAGTEMPPQLVSSTPRMPSSASVGTSDRVGLRLEPATARARSLPLWIMGEATLKIGAPKATWSPSTAFTSSEAPLYGTCITWAPAASSSISTPRCERVPTPPDE